MNEEPKPIWITCPRCTEQHVDKGVFATKSHHTHSCQNCGLTWRPMVEPTVGVQFLPGFKDDGPKRQDACTPAIYARPSVRAFAEAMEKKLRENDHKGGWDDEDWQYLLKRMREEIDELERVLVNNTHADRKDRIIREAADVSNFAMMIANNEGGLRHDMVQLGQAFPISAVYMCMEQAWGTGVGNARDEATGHRKPLPPDKKDFDGIVERIGKLVNP